MFGLRCCTEITDIHTSLSFINLNLNLNLVPDTSQSKKSKLEVSDGERVEMTYEKVEINRRRGEIERQSSRYSKRRELRRATKRSV